MRLPISCFVITQDEERRIGETIRAVRDWVDEVIVVDSGSTDGTQALARAEGARVVYNPWPGFGQQKRFAEEECRNNWLLNVDADEIVTPQLASEIRSLFDGGAPEAVAYGVHVRIIYPGWQLPRRWGRDHYCFRLYDRNRVRFRASAVHDSVVVGDEPVGHLRAPIYHQSFTSLSDFCRKCNVRASYQAVHAGRRPLSSLTIRLMSEFPVNFFKYYFVRAHCTGGAMGAMVAGIIAYYRWLRVVRMLRLRVPTRKGASGVGTLRPSASSVRDVKSTLRK